MGAAESKESEVSAEEKTNEIIDDWLNDIEKRAIISENNPELTERPPSPAPGMSIY